MTRIWVPYYDEVLNLFEHYKNQDKRIKRAKDELASHCYKQTSYIRKDPTNSFCDVPALMRFVEQQESLAEELNNQLNRIEELQKKVLFLLNKIYDPHNKIIKYFYIFDYTWVKISVETGYEKRQCIRFRDEAIREMALYYEELK